MSPAHIKTRITKDGEKRYLVYYRLSGRLSKQQFAGSFRTLKLAAARKETVDGWIAQGLDPKAELAKLKSPPTRRTFKQWADLFVASRLDVAPGTRRNYGHLALRLKVFWNRDPHTITPADVQDWITNVEGLRPASVQRVIRFMAMVLDYADIEPNPARSRKVRLPKLDREEPNPPSNEHVLAILARVKRRIGLVLVVLEQTSMRIGETLSLTWGDVDESGCRFRVRAAATKNGRAKWIDVPPWLMGLIAVTLPVEDRTPDRRVFQGVNEQAVRYAMTRACTVAKVPHYHPHDLRHRRASLWLQQGVPVREVQERGGWSRSSILLDVYAHVMPVDELAPDQIVEALR